jgi:hypothetical protein
MWLSCFFVASSPGQAASSAGRGVPAGPPMQGQVGRGTMPATQARPGGVGQPTTAGQAGRGVPASSHAGAPHAASPAVPQTAAGRGVPAGGAPGAAAGRAGVMTSAPYSGHAAGARPNPAAGWPLTHGMCRQTCDTWAQASLAALACMPVPSILWTLTLYMRACLMSHAPLDLTSGMPQAHRPVSAPAHAGAPAGAAGRGSSAPPAAVGAAASAGRGATTAVVDVPARPPHPVTSQPSGAVQVWQAVFALGVPSRAVCSSVLHTSSRALLPCLPPVAASYSCESLRRRWHRLHAEVS